MAITPLPTPPSRADSANFAVRGDAFVSALPAFATEANALQADVTEKQGIASAAASTAIDKATAAAASAGTGSGAGATGALGSENRAAQSETNAATAKAAAEAALDAFDDRYLGAKAIAPTLDNDGNALLVGAIYFDTAIGGGSWRAWNGSSWITAPAANASAVLNVPAGTLAAVNVQDALNELDTEKATVLLSPLFVKVDPRTPALLKTGAGTLSIKAGTSVLVSGSTKVFATDTAVTMPALTAGSDYSIWVKPDGAAVAVIDSFASPASAPIAGSVKIGGFHYGLVAPATTVAGGSFATTGNGMIWTQGAVDDIAGINKYSIWDVQWRAAGEQYGFALDPYARVWAPIYWPGTSHITNGLSKYNTDIASGTVLPKKPLAYGGNGSATYAQFNWWDASELANSHGCRLPSEREFVSFAFGVTENQSLGGASVTPPATARQPGYTSRIGLEQAAGHIWTWGLDSSFRNIDAATGNWYDANGGRGQIYLLNPTGLIRVLLGGTRDNAANSGSRAAYWNVHPWYSNWAIGVRAVSDHLNLAGGAR